MGFYLQIDDSIPFWALRCIVSLLAEFVYVLIVSSRPLAVGRDRDELLVVCQKFCDRVAVLTAAELSNHRYQVPLGLGVQLGRRLLCAHKTAQFLPGFQHKQWQQFTFMQCKGLMERQDE